MKKKRMQALLRYFLAVVLCAAVFLLFSAVYIKTQIAQENASAKKENEPYYTGPKSSGIHFLFEGGAGFFVYLDFKSSKSYFTLTDKADKTRIYDMPVNYVVNMDYNLLAAIIDRVGGATLEREGETMRYTGEQVVEMLAYFPDDMDLRLDVARDVFSSISKNGFSKEDFVYIIENSGTDLLVPDCFYWADYIKETVNDIEVIS